MSEADTSTPQAGRRVPRGDRPSGGLPTATGPSADMPAPPTAAWTVVRAAGAPAGKPDRVPRLRTVLLQIGAATVVAVVAIAVAGLLVSRHAAASESVHDAAEITDVLADTVVQPALTDAMATSPTAAGALDPLIRARVLSRDSIIRVKIWTPQGEILYSDEPRLVGQTYGLDSAGRSALSESQVVAEVSDLDEPENRYERGHGELLEVHRPMWTPGGRPLVLETYLRYDSVTKRAGSLQRDFAGIALGSLGLLLLLLLPVLLTLLVRSRQAQRQREEMLERAVDASLDERRRIAATLHDGVVQDLVAASLVVAGQAQEAQARGASDAAERLRAANDVVRASVGGMRSLLVDIYPPNLHEAGLPVALRDLAGALHLDAELTIDDTAAEHLSREHVEAVFRVAQEALRNVATHARASTVGLTLYREHAFVVLEITDDGVGFDPAVRPEGHFGLSLMGDVAREHGAELAVRTAPGAGTSWRLRVAQDVP